MRKKILAAAAATCALLILLPSMIVNAAGSYFFSEGFSYGVKNGEAYVHGYEGSDWDIVIREKFLSYPVTAVEKYAFFENDTMEALSFYDAVSLNSIGDCAFARCTKLERVDITPAVQNMGVGVFDGCSSLSYVRFRAGALTDIPAQTFYGCSLLKTVIFENEVTDIGNFAFANCTGLEYLELGKSVTHIADSAFQNDSNLTLGVWYGSYSHHYAENNGVPYVLLDDVKLGDVNDDGVVNIIDVTAIQRHVAELERLDGIYLLAADINHDGRINIADATALQRYLAGYEVEYPIGKKIQS